MSRPDGEGSITEAEIRADERRKVTGEQDELRRTRAVPEGTSGIDGVPTVGSGRPDDAVDRSVTDGRDDPDTVVARGTVHGPVEDRHLTEERLRFADEQRRSDERDDGHPDRVGDEVEVVRKRSFSVGQLLTLLVGAALVTLGVFALVATGVETPLDQPVEQVLGYGHTPWLGLMEVAAGALLVILSLRPGGRWFVAVVGAALIVGSLIVIAELGSVVDSLGTEASYAWIPLIAGVLAVVGALLTPRRHQRLTGVPTN